MTTRPLLTSAALALLLGAATPADAAEAPRVAVSIKPVHSLVAGVMEGVAEPALLVPGGASPHAYAMRPSEAQALQQADLVVWVGPGLESFLARPIETLAGDAAVLELMNAEPLTLLPARSGGAWEAHAHDHGHAGETAAQDHADEPTHDHDHADEAAAHDHAHDESGHSHAEESAHDHAHGEEAHAGESAHDHDGADPHVWLSVDNARAIVAATAETLSGLDPAHAATYRANADAMAQALDRLNRDLRERLEGVGDAPTIVFHDAYQYFEADYGLNVRGSITVDPEQPPSARRLAEIRGTIEEVDAACVFAEPQFAPRLAETAVEGTGARLGTLDPLGADLPAGPEQYGRLMQGLADSYRDCVLGTS